MTSQATLAGAQDICEIDDRSFHTHLQRAADDPTGVPDFLPEEAGDSFTPFNVGNRDFYINMRPPTPLQLSQLFVPISLIQSWIKYINAWVTHLIENGVIDNWNTPLKPWSRILKWEGIFTATTLGAQVPLHPITKFMPLNKFLLITRFIRTFDHTQLDVSDEMDLPKIWVVAQHGSFMRWLWHVKATPYKAVIVKLPPPHEPKGKQGKLETTVALSNTQSVFIHLCNMLPKMTYHVFTDNLFSSPNLFRALREAGCGATGTARPNYGVSKELKDAKEGKKAGKGPALQYNEVRAIPTKDKKVIQIGWKDSGI
ncbi:ac transposable element-derived 4 [Fusarium subglutinans]|uniref:Ac transposable element-derived 4 n=1 Tax=Gibberella subglutinans TaxID=42677 RepID=A0A8H5L504_GIBSU|nr:ac transposable element-derived 4 [Fusarium subglutinans]KAF5584351.1 ac transposable element-derived 4 [Fusarium subglutinans]